MRVFLYPADKLSEVQNLRHKFIQAKEGEMIGLTEEEWDLWDNLKIRYVDLNNEFFKEFLK